MSSTAAVSLQGPFTPTSLAPLLPDVLRHLISGPVLAKHQTSDDASMDPWELLDQAVDYAIAAEQIIAEQSAQIAELQHMALADPLTGLCNRRAFERALAETLDMNRRHGDTAVLVFIDLDGFKQVNDRYGHAAGDELLVLTASLLQDELRASDVIARMGGDEFTALLRRAQPKEGGRRAEAIRRRLNMGGISVGKTRVPLRASLGFQVIDGESSVEQALQCADLAMYANKRARRAADA